MQQMRQREKKHLISQWQKDCHVSSSSPHVVWGPEDKYNELPKNS